MECVLKHIELFAGCGGLSLGLEKSGFELAFANELSPMAAETFAYNFLGEDLAKLASGAGMPTNTIWLSSANKGLKERLRENPFEYPELGSGYCDLNLKKPDIIGKLLVGNIIHLNALLRSNKNLLHAAKCFDAGGIDLVSGGPPCQSFSMAGLRKKDCDKNALPWEFSNFVELIQPKVAVLENVTGILRAFKDDGVEFYAWFEVAKAFAEKGYVPLCLHVNARLAGVPQNRPRFIMISLRADIYDAVRSSFNESEEQLFDSSKLFFDAVKAKRSVELRDLQYFDVSNASHLKLFMTSFLSPLVSGIPVTAKDAIDDLKFSNPKKSSLFVRRLNELYGFKGFNRKMLRNHEPRANNEQVKRRFRIYQVLSEVEKNIAKEVVSILKGETSELSVKAWKLLARFEYLSNNEKPIRFSDKKKFISYLSNHKTKKMTQKALLADSPAPAALSIPDDACHYDHNELRTLTVREMARIQSFPDGFVFRSKVTTGGKMRKFEVPQYTQVGNAVPSLLGYALGQSIRTLLERVEE